MLNFNIESFIKKHITKRELSFFKTDINKNSNELNQKIKGNKVLVIGGAGTIGSSFIKALLPFDPGSLTVVDYSENGLTELTRDLRSNPNLNVPGEYITYPFDFGGEVFAKLFAKESYDIIACFAAHKHVRSEKDHLAIEAMIRNNVFNTYNLIQLAKKSNPKHLFSVSTDKAANPVNVMGASKKLMEKVLLAFSKELKITTARFANVAFSNGSLLFGFNERIAKRQPLSAPSDVRRYFVSPEESGQLCLLACLLGDSSDIFFPKLSVEQMKTFSDIAIAYLSELGLSPDYCSTETEAKEKAAKWKSTDSTYPVYFFKTSTSGEKKFEEFYTEQDELDMNTLSAIGIVKNTTIDSIGNIESLLENFRGHFAKDGISKADIVKLMTKYLSGFKHIETGENLDSKM